MLIVTACGDISVHHEMSNVIVECHGYTVALSQDEAFSLAEALLNEAGKIING